MPQVPEKAVGPNTDEIVSFKSLDSMLDEYSGSVEGYERLLSRKNKLLDLVKRR